MMKNKKQLFWSSVLILLPVLVGLLLWNRLPDRVATHWGLGGEPNGWSSKTFTVFGMPLFLLAIHWFCLFFTGRDVKNKDQNSKVFRLVSWLVPALSFMVFGVIYGTALGLKFQIGNIVFLFTGILFIAVGNYLPKCKQNRTIGIKVKWALENEENWNATHRMAGKVWVIGGICFMLCVFLPPVVAAVVEVGGILALVAIPTIYSYNYSKKQQRK